MKKQLLLLIPALLLAGCQQSQKESQKDIDTSKLKIVCPTGAPAFAFYNHAYNDNFETNSVPSNIVAMLSESSNKDVVVIDTVSGIKAINNGAPYKLAATITFGNFFIAGTGHDYNKSMDSTDKIVLFGEHQTPDLIFHYLYGNSYDSAIEYVGNVQDAAKCLISKKNAVTGSDIDYVFVAQPVLYNALQKNTDAYKFIDIQDAYGQKSEGKSMIQASIFIKNSVEEDVGHKFLDELSSDITTLLDNPETLMNTIGKENKEEMTALYGVAPEIATAVLNDNNGLGLNFSSAAPNKDNIDSFISLFSLPVTDEKIYF